MQHILDHGSQQVTEKRSEMRLAAVLWTSLIVYFIAQVIAQAAWTTPYSLLDNRVSDLGITACGHAFGGAQLCSPQHVVMNVGLVVTGVLILLGAFLIRRAWPRRRLTTWGLVFLAVTGAGTILVGMSPENVNVPLHLLGALNIPCGNMALLMLGLANRRLHPHIANLALVLAAIGILGMLGGPVLIAVSGHGGGLSERLALYPPILWMIMVGGGFLRQSKS